MWFDDSQNLQWISLWSGYVSCINDCLGIRKIDECCPACQSGPFDNVPEMVDVKGVKVAVYPAFAGAEGKLEDYIYLQILQREWERPTAPFECLLQTEDRSPSPKAALVLLFWGYFEARIERLHRSAMRDLPQPVLDHMLQRHSGIGSRLYQLYKIFFGTTYFEDLRSHGFEEVVSLLKDVHERRNAFTHGRPQAIDDEIVTRLVGNLKNEHEARINLYNRRVAGETVR